jgi:hypothetical protein
MKGLIRLENVRYHDVCTYARMITYIHMYCRYEYIFIHIYKCEYMYKYAYIHTFVYRCIYTFVNIYIYI